MPLTRLIYDLYLDDPADPTADPAEHRVTVRPADQMVGEPLAHRNGIGPMEENQIAHAVCWAYAAARRQGVFPGEFQQFRALLAHIEKVEEEEVPPTEGASGSDSASPDFGATPPTG